jgi:2-methylaconitate cis-trans-isomerase PrpF
MFQRQSLRAVLCRSGTSKGLFLRRSDLPPRLQDWTPIILSAVGSPDPYRRQLDGLGGGSSTTSKVAIVGPCEDRGVAGESRLVLVMPYPSPFQPAPLSTSPDVDYTFVQVPVNADKLDFSGNCGNMSAGVGPFAVE